MKLHKITEARRLRSISFLALAFSLFTLVVTTTACASSSSASEASNPLPQYTTSHPLVIGTNAQNVIMEHPDPNNPAKLVGFDITMVDSIMKHFGVPYELKNLSFAGLIPAIQGKQIDVIVSSMFASPERLKVLNFITYLQGGTVGIVPKENPHNVHSLDDICGLTFEGLVGGLEDEYVLNQSSKCQKAGKPAAKLGSYPDTSSEFLALSQGRGDGALVDAATTLVLLKKYPQYERVFLLKTYPVGAGARKSDTALNAFLLKGLKWFRHSPGYARALKANHLASDLAIKKVQLLK